MDLIKAYLEKKNVRSTRAESYAESWLILQRVNELLVQHARSRILEKNCSLSTRDPFMENGIFSWSDVGDWGDSNSKMETRLLQARQLNHKNNWIMYEGCSDISVGAHTIDLKEAFPDIIPFDDAWQVLPYLDRIYVRKLEEITLHDRRKHIVTVSFSGGISNGAYPCFFASENEEKVVIQASVFLVKEVLPNWKKVIMDAFTLTHLVVNSSKYFNWKESSGSIYAQMAVKTSSLLESVQEPKLISKSIGVVEFIRRVMLATPLASENRIVNYPSDEDLDCNNNKNPLLRISRVDLTLNSSTEFDGVNEIEAFPRKNENMDDEYISDKLQQLTIGKDDKTKQTKTPFPSKHRLEARKKGINFEEEINLLVRSYGAYSQRSSVYATKNATNSAMAKLAIDHLEQMGLHPVGYKYVVGLGDTVGLNDSSESFYIIGEIDLIMMDGEGNISIIDLKATDSKKSYPLYLRDVLQLHLYSLAFYRTTNVIPSSMHIYRVNTTLGLGEFFTVSFRAGMLNSTIFDSQKHSFLHYLKNSRNKEDSPKGVEIAIITMANAAEECNATKYGTGVQKNADISQLGRMQVSRSPTQALLARHIQVEGKAGKGLRAAVLAYPRITPSESVPTWHYTIICLSRFIDMLYSKLQYSFPRTFPVVVNWNVIAADWSSHDNSALSRFTNIDLAKEIDFGFISDLIWFARQELGIITVARVPRSTTHANLIALFPPDYQTLRSRLDRWLHAKT